MIIIMVLVCLCLAHPLLKASEIKDSMSRPFLQLSSQQELEHQEKVIQDRQKFKRSDPIPVPWPSAESPWQAWKIEERLNVIMGRCSIRSKIRNFTKRDSSNSDEEINLSVLLFKIDDVATHP